MLKLERKEQSMELLDKVLDDKNLYRAYEQVYKNSSNILNLAYGLLNVQWLL